MGFDGFGGHRAPVHPDAARLGRREADRALRDAAGHEQAQADWAEVGRFTLPNGEPVRLYAFVMVLSFSRTLYVEFTRSACASRP